MTTYIMFCSITLEAAMQLSPARTEDAISIVNKHGKFQAAYALVGEKDFMIIADFPDIQSTMRAALALTRRLGYPFRSMPALPIAEFDKLIS